MTGGGDNIFNNLVDDTMNNGERCSLSSTTHTSPIYNQRTTRRLE